jgi:kumamolisin
VTGTHASRLILDVAGTTAAVDAAFGTRLSRYVAADGRVFHAPETAPSVPTALAGRLAAVVGLNTAALRRPHLRQLSSLRPLDSTTIAGIGTGPDGGLTPSDIKTAYNLSGVSQNGSGQTMAVFELDGYTASDIQAYESKFGLPDVPLQNVLVDGAAGKPGSDADEVTLDIELQTALASAVNGIMVYETVNSDTGILDGYGKIADDDQAQEISTSWGLDEQDNDSGFIQSENAIFEQMAAQGQTIYSASGDDGAYDSGAVADGLRVDDPGSQPYVCGVGGTQMTTTAPGGSYVSETTWNDGSPSAGASGGGISAVWPIPSWQTPVVGSNSEASTTMRNVPDISLNAEPDTGYAIYYRGRWSVYGGASCAAPLWAGFTALVNQQRAADGQSPLGQANPALYAIAQSDGYSRDFHDIADDSTNLHYHAVAGYDLATGLGTMNGANLLTDLTAGVHTSNSIPAAPTDLSATAAAHVTLTWLASANATGYNIYRSLTSGSGYAQIASSTTAGDTDTSVTPGTTYYYVVTAVDSEGESGYSNQAAATPSASAVATFPAGVSFISLPYDYTGVPLPTIFGGESVTLAVWEPALLQYVMTPVAPANQIVLGSGYWVDLPSAVTVTTSGAAASTESPYAIGLSAGWNQIGDPFPTSESISSLQVGANGKTYSFADAVTSGLIGADLYSYNPSSGGYTPLSSGGSLQPDLGYWIYAASGVILQVPAP